LNPRLKVQNPHTIKKKKSKMLKWTFFKEDTQIKRYSTSLVIKEKEIKIIMKYHLTPTVIAIIKESGNSQEPVAHA
jgi:hypothetical protein